MAKFNLTHYVTRRNHLKQPTVTKYKPVIITSILDLREVLLSTSMMSQ